LLFALRHRIRRRRRNLHRLPPCNNHRPRRCRGLEGQRFNR